MATTTKAKRTLKQFAKDAKRSECRVCKLPEEAREQLRGASDAKIKIDIQLRWVEADYSVALTADEILRHRTERHDTP